MRPNRTRVDRLPIRPAVVAVVVLLLLFESQPVVGQKRKGKMDSDSPAKPGEFPWHVMVVTGESLCSGSIIKEDYILTAASCLPRHLPANQTSVIIGVLSYNASNIAEDSKEIMVESYNIHPSFNPNEKKRANYDIAVLKLSEKIKFRETKGGSPGIKAVRIDLKEGDSFSDRYDIPGWGLTECAHNPPDVLQKLSNARNYGCFQFSDADCMGTDQAPSLCAADPGSGVIFRSWDGPLLRSVVSGLFSFDKDQSRVEYRVTWTDRWLFQFLV